MERKKKIETSKLILLASYIIGITLTLIVIICTFMGIECSNITTIAGAAWLEISASNVFYYNMNKKLNLPKVVMCIYKELPDKLRDEVDINTLLSSLIN